MLNRYRLQLACSGTLGCLIIAVAFWFTGSSGSADRHAEAWQKINNGAVLVDVRTSDEFSEGHLQGAVNVPYEEVVDWVAQQQDITLDSDIVLYCHSGKRSGKAEKWLQNREYQNALNAGGYKPLLESQPGS